jgi:hypothetical protein
VPALCSCSTVMAAAAGFRRHDRIGKLIVTRKVLRASRRNGNDRENERKSERLADAKDHAIDVVRPVPPFNPYSYSCGASTMGS